MQRLVATYRYHFNNITQPTTLLNVNFSSCPQTFCSRAINAVFEDQDHMGFGSVNAHMEYTEFANQLNALEADLQLDNPQSL